MACAMSRSLPEGKKQDDARESHAGPRPDTGRRTPDVKHLVIAWSPIVSTDRPPTPRTTSKCLPPNAQAQRTHPTRRGTQLNRNPRGARPCFSTVTSPAVVASGCRPSGAGNLANRMRPCGAVRRTHVGQKSRAAAYACIAASRASLCNRDGWYPRTPPPRPQGMACGARHHVTADRAGNF